MSWERSEDGWSGYGALATSFIALGAGIFDSYHSASMPCPLWASVCPHRQMGLDAVMSPLSVTPVYCGLDLLPPVLGLVSL